MAKKESKKSKKETQKESKKEPEISVQDFIDISMISNRYAFFLDKKYGEKKRTQNDWEKICKDENISL